MNNHELDILIRNAFNASYENALRFWPSLPRPVLQIVEAMKPAGTAHPSGVIQINRTYARQNISFIGSDTVPHEMAHWVCFFFRMDNGHGRNWRRVAAMLGANPRAKFKADTVGITVTTQRKRTAYLYTMPSGINVWVSDVRHNRIQRGTHGYTATATGEPIAAAHYSGQTR